MPALLAARLALYSACYFAYAGVQMPYWPVWLADRGLGPEQIGLLLAAGFAIRIVANPAIAAVVDRLGVRRLPMLALGLAGFASYAALGGTETHPAILVLSVLAAIATSALLPLGDVLTLTLAHRHGLDYGRIRLWGSLTFILTSAAAGWAIGRFGAPVTLWAILGLLVLVLGAVLALPEVRVPAAERRPGAMRALLAEPSFLLFAAAASLVQSSHAVLYAFGTLDWQARGIGEGAIGVLWATGVVAEIVLFWLARPLLLRIGVAGMLLLAAGAAVLRWVASAFVDAYLGILALQVLHAFTFGATHLAAMHFLQRAVPAGAAASAQSLYAAASGGIAMGLAMLLAGRLYADAGSFAYLAMAAQAAVGGALALALGRRWSGGSLLP